MPIILEVRAAAAALLADMEECGCTAVGPGMITGMQRKRARRAFSSWLFARAVKGDSVESVIFFAESEPKETYRT